MRDFLGFASVPQNTLLLLVMHPTRLGKAKGKGQEAREKKCCELSAA